MKLQWSADFSVENEKMDGQHQRLFDIINSFYDAVDSGASFTKLQSVFQEVLDFTAYHFAEEEALLERQNYPKLGEHKIIHQTLVQRVQELMADLNSEAPGSPDKVKLFLKNWLTSHIKGIDKQYAPYVHGTIQKSA